jgi:hypothetical protein
MPEQVAKVVQTFCSKHSVAFKSLDWMKVRGEDHDTFHVLLEADILVVDFGQSGDGALLLSGLIAQRYVARVVPFLFSQFFSSCKAGC